MKSNARWMALYRSPGILLTITTVRQWLIIVTAFAPKWNQAAIVSLTQKP